MQTEVLMDIQQIADKAKWNLKHIEVNRDLFILTELPLIKSTVQLSYNLDLILINDVFF